MIKKIIKYGSILFCALAVWKCDDDGPKADVKIVDCDTEINNPNCYSTSYHSTPLSGLDENYKSDVHGEGDVVAFRWDENLAWFLESKKHAYGYDRDPYSNYAEDAPERGRDVYMSVEKGQEAQVTIYVDPETVHIYHLHKIDENKNIIKRDVIDVSTICSKSTSDPKCKKDYSLSEGIYAVYYATDEGEIDKERYLHVLGYDKKPPYQIDFVQFGDALEDHCVISEGGNGCYTIQWVEDRFNEVMKQAVVEGHFNPLEAENIGLDKFFTIDLTEQHGSPEDDDDTPVVGFMVSKIRKSKQYGYGEAIQTFKDSFEEMKLYCTESGGSFEGSVIENGESIGYSALLCSGINDENDLSHYNGLQQTMKTNYDRISNARADVDSKHLALGINKMRIQWTFDGNGKIVLNNHGVFQRAAEVMGTTKLKMILEEIGKSTPVPISVTVENRDEGNDRFEARIYGAPSLESTKKYRIYADIYPFVPEYPFVPNNYGAAQITYHYGNPVKGGIVWGSHLDGDASLNTIIHEIGHSFGLTDLFIADDDLSYPGNYIRYVKDPKNPVDAIPSFAFDESNIMWYAGDSGKRLRYRPLFVAGTGVGNKLPILDATGKPIKDSHGKILYETENQWECIRSSEKCYRGK